MSRRQSALLVCLLVVLATLQVTSASRLIQPDPLASVSTVIGAGGIGFQAGGIPPGAQVPFGAYRLSPDTSLDAIWLAFQHFGGYSYMDTHIRCFSHTHMVGAGVGDWGNFGVMAFSQPMASVNFKAGWYRSAFNHSNEVATPGLYTVQLDTPLVFARMTAAGTMAGMHEYNFAPRTAAAPASIIILDVCTQLNDHKGACSVANVDITINPDNTVTVTAYVLLRGGLTARGGGVNLYFVASIYSDSGAPIDYGVWNDNVVYSKQTSGTTNSTSLGAYFDFTPSDASASTTVTISTAISFIGSDLADQNLATQMAAVPSKVPGQPSFDEIVANTQMIWAKQLGVIEISLEVDDDEEEEVDIKPNAASFTMMTFDVTDTNCTQGITGLLEFQSDMCVLTPTSVQPQYNSFQLYNVMGNNYSINLYAESPLCDDFVGWFTNGTLGNLPQDCQTTLYFSFLINETTAAAPASSTTAKKAKKDVATNEDAIKFYSLLYHTFLAPTSYLESGNQYLGFDNQVHTWNYTHADGSPSYYMSDMSLWDTHRTQNPLLGLLAPNVGMDIIRSLYTMYQEGGDIPRWPLANIYTGCMAGDHGLISIVDFLVKDVPAGELGFDVQDLYTAMFDMITTERQHAGRTDLPNYTTIGYVPFDSDFTGAALTLEYAYDDWAVGVLATQLGQDADAELLAQRALNYRNVWASEQQFMCPRFFNGSFQCPTAVTALLPYPFATGYIEADAWQEVWFVPHDPVGLISLFPSVDAFLTKLTTFIESGFNWIFPHEELPNNYYWSGNEPDIFAPWLFNWAGRPDLTQNMTRAILKRRYQANGENGLPGNDDYGTISAWATWTALGLYPQSGNTTYALGSPLFPQVIIHRSPALGGDLTILAPGTSDSNLYVSSVMVDNVPLVDAPFILHQQLNGATLQFTMTSTPPTTATTTEPRSIFDAKDESTDLISTS